MLNLLDGRVGCHFRWEMEEGKRGFSAFGKCFSSFSNDSWGSVRHAGRFDANEGDEPSTDFTHSDSLSSLVSIAKASILLVREREAIRGVPVTWVSAASLTINQQGPLE